MRLFVGLFFMALIANFSAIGETDTTKCALSEEECIRVLIGNIVYIHDGTKIEEQIQ